MNHLSLLILIGLPVIAVAQPIDFSPNFETSLEDGVSIKRMYFRCGSSRIYFKPAGSWEITGGTDSIVFRDKRLRNGSIKFENAPSRTPAAGVSGGLEEYRKTAYSLLPPDAAAVKEISETADAVEINDWAGSEFFFSYNSSGRQHHRSILFITLGPEREMRVIVDAHPEDFEELHAALVRSLARWYEERR